MLSLGSILLFVALVLFVLAGFNVPRDGRVRCEWFAFAFIVAAVMVGHTPLAS